MVYIDNGYDPCIGDVVYFDPVWLGRHVVTDVARLKNDHTLIKVARIENSNGMCGWFNKNRVITDIPVNKDIVFPDPTIPIGRVEDFHRSTPRFLIQDSELFEFLTADEDFHKYIKEIMNIL